MELDSTATARVIQKLDRICADHNVRIPLAVESGSRAWGFPSPDSDYDCRFFFVRSLDDYACVWHPRDVIELPPDPIFDINGWDLIKVIPLLIGGNAVAVEWLMSPLRYIHNPEFAIALLRFADTMVPRDRVINHYRRLGVHQRRTYFADTKQVQLKKLFYALRPAAALRWLRLHPDAAIAPMNFPVLMEECDPPLGVKLIVRDLLAKKAVTSEMGEGPLPLEIATFVDHEFILAESAGDPAPLVMTDWTRACAEELFVDLVSKTYPVDSVRPHGDV